MIRVTAHGLVKRYDRVAVVDGASLEIEPGEITCLLGPSGAGKTTLARLLAGLEAPDDGELYFDERLVNGVSPQERRVGMVFQDDALWPGMTVAENVGYGLAVRKVSRSERRERVAEALGALRIDSLASKHPDELSGSQRQRAALARALASRPELLILDDPLGRLEPRVRDEVRDELRRLHAETGLTTLVLACDPREAMALADRVAVMDLGKIVQVGPPHEVYNRPAGAFVAHFLGPTNLVQGQVEGHGGLCEVIVRTPFGRLIGRTSPAAEPPPVNGSEPLPLGTPVTLSIRPESLVLGGAVPADSNRFPATIDRVVFLGEVRKVYLRGPGGWPALALALQVGSESLREGQSLTVSVPPERVVVLPGKYATPW
jgi:ABC-type Fe3+/spermidine/putrescine transport system ATPase subunit